MTGGRPAPDGGDPAEVCEEVGPGSGHDAEGQPKAPLPRRHCGRRGQSPGGGSVGGETLTSRWRQPGRDVGTNLSF